MANKIQVKRGVFASLPAPLDAGEFGFCTNTKQLYIGDGTNNYELARIDGSPNDNEFARFTASGLEGLTYAQVMAALNGQAGANFSMNSKKITGLAAPTADGDAVRKSYVDGLAAGLDFKESCDVVTTGALPSCTPAGTGVGKTLTANSVGVLTVDGVATALGDRILVKNQAAGDDNGIYAVTTEGTSGVAFILTRATDCDEDDEVTAGLFTFVSEGTVNADAAFVLTTNDPIAVDTTSLAFTQFSGAGSITAGSGMTKTGDTLNVIGGTGITANANDIEVDYGTGIGTACQGNDARLSDARTPSAHKDSHDPQDGSDKLDTAAAAEISGVVAAGVGSSHSFSRADHVHAIVHGIADNHIVTMDDADAASTDYAKFTANGLQGRSVAEVLSDISVEANAVALATVKADADISDAISKKHAQNTDTGTTGTEFKLYSGSANAIMLKVDGGDLSFKNYDDSVFKSIRADDLISCGNDLRLVEGVYYHHIVSPSLSVSITQTLPGVAGTLLNDLSTINGGAF